jgi:hypothetical protein
MMPCLGFGRSHARKGLWLRMGRNHPLKARPRSPPRNRAGIGSGNRRNFITRSAAVADRRADWFA